MIQIRDNTFETNSSSSHSLIITDIEGRYTPEEMMKGVYIGDNGKVFMHGTNLEFYRSPFDLLATFKSKSRYAIASSGGKFAEQIAEIWKKFIPNFKCFKFDETYDYWSDEEEKWIESETPAPCYGGTDDYEIEGWLKKYNVSLEDFLTMRQYMVVVDGDESRIWYHILDAGLFDTSHIIHDSEKEYQEYMRELYGGRQ